MNAQHTLGPWRVDGNDPDGRLHIVTDEDEPWCLADIVQFAFYGDEPDPTAANAKLMSAAPDLLRACKLMFEILRRKSQTCKNSAWKVSDQKAFEAAESAITKAE